MKKTIGLIIMLMMVSTVFGAVFEIENNTYKILVTMINQEPDPVEPGNMVEVKFRVENLMREAAKNMEVKVEPKYPFSLYGNEEQIKKIGTIAPLQTGDLGVRVDYKILVDKNAAEGESELEFYYRTDGGAWVKPDKFYIDVRSSDAVLAINEIDADKMLPGKQTKVSFKLDNMAGSVLKNIKLKLEVRESLETTTSITFNEMPFTPIGSSNEKTVNYISPGKSKSVDFDLFIDANAESKVYKVPYTLTYSDEAGTEYSRTGYVGLMVDAEPDLSVNIDTTTIYSKGNKGTVTIKFVNKGFSDIKFLDVVLKKEEDFEILTNPEVYIGNLDSDDYETADYTLLVSKDASDEVVLPLTVEYRNSNGKFYSNLVNLKLDLYSGNDLKQRTDGGGNSFIGVIIIIVIVAAGIFVWRWRKKRKKQR